MEVTVKLRLLLTSALFLFAQMATMQAQETLDLRRGRRRTYDTTAASMIQRDDP